jgi:hypothetical protein
LLDQLAPLLANTGMIDTNTLTGDVASGGAAGAVLTAIVGLIKNKMADNAATRK